MKTLLCEFWALLPPMKEFDCDVKGAQHGIMRHTIKGRNDPPKDCLHDKNS